MGNPNIDDIDRTGADLLERIEWLTNEMPAYARDGWLPLLAACKREIERLRAELENIEDHYIGRWERQ